MLGVKLNPDKARETLLRPLKKLYQQLDDVTLQMELLKIHFVLTLMDIFDLPTFIRHFLPFLLEALRLPQPDLARMASKTLIHLVTDKHTRAEPQFGWMLSVSYILTPLLEQVGKGNAAVVVQTLLAIALHLPEALVIHHYLPMLVPILQRLSATSAPDSRVLTNLLFLFEGLVEKVLCPETILKEFVHPNILGGLMLVAAPPSALVTPPTYVFPLIKTLIYIVRAVDPSSTEKYVLRYVQQFVGSYSLQFATASEPGDKQTESPAYSKELGLQLYALFLTFKTLIGQHAFPSDFTAFMADVSRRYGSEGEQKSNEEDLWDSGLVDHANHTDSDGGWGDKLPHDRFIGLADRWPYQGESVYTFKVHMIFLSVCCANSLLIMFCFVCCVGQSLIMRQSKLWPCMNQKHASYQGLRMVL
eukprot:TRINITY_DN4041_c0_g1_i6.p1 TRINITY_DN4041_c0_g1~~TRINITY_DN4041_c0_g1_i6.p1  ORF type:complete len:417 (+),score=33.32 TRINITY_DN4041_c0_g1_i6:377-1627(+)